MSFNDYSNIIASYSNKANQRRENAEGRYANFKSGFSQRGLSVLDNLEEKANANYQAGLEKLQESALKNLGITEQDRAKAEAIVSGGIVAGPIIENLLKTNKKKVGTKELKEKLKKAKEVKQNKKVKLDDEAEKLDRGDLVGQEKIDRGDLVGQEKIEEPKLTKRQMEKRPQRPKDVEMKNLRDPDELQVLGDSAEKSGFIPAENPTEAPLVGPSSAPTGIDSSIKERTLKQQLTEKLKANKLETDKVKTPEPLSGESNLGIQQAAEEGVGNLATQEAAEDVGKTIATDVGESLLESSALDVIPGVGELAMIGSAAYGIGEAFGLWGGGHKDDPIQATPHLKSYSVQQNVAMPTFRSQSKALATPTINTAGVMR